ncbi:MAG: hypothetical protein JKY53_01460 [Flavobacteriales bacterium]|nr:hypothetical protein [Flavobacteriales bacterium]
MRLGQLARKLDVKPAEIINYLASEHKTEMNTHPNSKVDDKLVPAVSEHFGNSTVAEVVTEEKVVVKVKETIPEEKIVEKVEAPKPEKKADPKKVEVIVVVPKNKLDENGEEIINPAPEFEEPIDYDSAEHIETVKAEKLTGLKVVKKIDLPPPPPPKMIEVDGVMMEETEFKKKKAEEHKQRKLARKSSIDAGYAKRSRRQDDERNTGDNEFVTEREKKKKDQEFEKNLQKKQDIIAKKRKEHYALNNVGSSVISKKKKKKKKVQKHDPLFSDELVDESSPVETTQQLAEPKLTGLSKLWKWFNT